MPSAPSKSTTVINSLGQWLNGDAAASYLRMLAAGCPTGGISGMGAGRTYAEQKRLYDLYRAGKGNLAAKPGTSLHEKGNALDLERGTPAQRWAVYGGDPYKVKAGEKLRCHAYGWRRTVSSEAWHLSYDRAKDAKRAADLKARLAKLGYKDVKSFQRAHGLTADGVDGPVTWAALLGSPKPAPTPPKPAPKPLPVPTLGRLGALNCGTWGKRITASLAAGIVGVLKRIDASIYTLTECPEQLRTLVRQMMPGGAARWRVVVRQGQAILFDAKKWRLVTGVPVPSMVFGPTVYHGGLYATFEQTTTKAQITVGCYHLPPNSVSSQSYQRQRLQQFAAKVKGRPAILGGDGADSGTWLDWQDARLHANASPNREAPTYGKTIRDRAHTLGLTVRKYTVVPSKGATDHEGLLIQYSIPA